METKEYFDRMFATAFFIATHKGAFRRDIVAFLIEKFGPGDAYEGAITRHVGKLNDLFRMRIRGSARRGFKIYDWGLVNQDVFMRCMAAQLGEKLPEPPATAA